MIEYGTDGRPADPSVEPFRSVLSHRYRRLAVRRIADAGDALHLADLARDLARLEAAADPERSAEDGVDRIYARLYHVHLPKLRDGGALSFDDEAKLVSPTPETEAIAATVAAVADVADPEP